MNFMPTICNPLRSKRVRISPQSERWTASGLRMISVRSNAMKLSPFRKVWADVIQGQRMSDNPPVIGYGKEAVAWYARRRTWAISIAVVLLLGVCAIGWYFGEPYFEQYQHVRQQNRYKSDILPPGTVV